ncbi:ABC transporter ATP-binding protein [Candidatus Omnitrophota bacterium]
MSGDCVVKAEHLSKKFSRLLKYVMYYGVKDITKAALAIPSGSGELRKNEFWAVDDVSFELNKSRTLGVIGVNGSGKSTLLKMINGIFMPDRGKITVKGSVGALIEVGAGFHPMLTGRENIYVNGAILGQSKREIDGKFDDIVEFASIGDFIDTPVKYYSSGMFVRLGFAIAVHCEPDILLIDEILSVGDIAFQERCLRRMDEIRKSETSIMYVSHNMYNIEALCDQVLWIDKGKMRAIGNTREVVSKYYDELDKKKLSDRQESKLKSAQDESLPIVVEKVELIGAEGSPKKEFTMGEDMKVRIYYQAKRRIRKPLFNIRILFRGQGVAEADMLIDGHGPEYIEGSGSIECELQHLPLTPKVYDIFLFARAADGVGKIMREDIYTRFRITEDKLDKIPMSGPAALTFLQQGSPVYIPRVWRW